MTPSPFRLIPYLCLFIALLACGPSADQQQQDQAPTNSSGSPSARDFVPDDWNALEADSLRTLALAVHDSIMPQMGPLMKLERRLRTLEDAGESRVDSTLNALNQAERGMRVWMRGFDPTVPLEADTARPYYRRQLELILEVRRQMRSSMEKARQQLPESAMSS